MDRSYFDAYGRDDAALREGVRWLISEAVGGRGVIAVPGLTNVEHLVPGVTASEAQQLKKTKQRQRQGVTLELWTERTHTSVRGVPVLAVWLDDEQLGKIEAASPSAICVIPWTRDEVARWLETHSPRDARTGAAAPAITITNEIVHQALLSLTARVNRSTGLGHPSDKAAAVGAFRRLLAGGESFDPNQVAAWAGANGWSFAAAGELADIARGVAAGKQYRIERDGWREDILEVWRQNAAGDSHH